MSKQSRPELFTAKSAQRLPPPFLFQGPPSRNTSNLSLPSGLAPGKGSTDAQSPSQATVSQHASPSRARPNDSPRLGSPFAGQPQARRQSDADGADAIWDEMQNTLAEVELSASNGTHVFGTNHSKALEELRAKQLALAQAWARSEMEEAPELASSEAEGTTAAAAAAAGKSAAASAAASDAARAGSTTTAGGEDGPHKFVEEEQTEKDILHARKRREANDRYFDRVNGSVMDVVAKLEEVADAMREVERESTEIWSESGSMTSPGPSHG